MTSGKSDQKSVAKVFAIIGMVIIASFFRISVTDIISDEEREGKLIVHMIDVGQADSFLLIQENQIALIDCGTRETGRDVVKSLKRLNITKLDYVIGTHPHEDHMGGMYDILCDFEIETIILPNVKSGKVTTNWYLKLMQKIKNDGYHVRYAEKGDIYNLQDATLEVISAQTNCDNINNYSIVTKVSFGEINMIMTGDYLSGNELKKKVRK